VRRDHQSCHPWPCYIIVMKMNCYFRIHWSSQTVGANSLKLFVLGFCRGCRVRPAKKHSRGHGGHRGWRHIKGRGGGSDLIECSRQCWDQMSLHWGSYSAETMLTQVQRKEAFLGCATYDMLSPNIATLLLLHQHTYIYYQTSDISFLGGYNILSQS
jgi:hypothetical protein